MNTHTYIYIYIYIYIYTIIDHTNTHTHTHTHRDSTFNIGTLRGASTKFANEANRMRRLVPTKFIELILMHLSIILDLSGVLFDELKTSLTNNDVGKISSSVSSSTRGKHSRTKNTDKG